MEDPVVLKLINQWNTTGYTGQLKGIRKIKKGQKKTDPINFSRQKFKTLRQTKSDQNFECLYKNKVSYLINQGLKKYYR